ncbi:MAG: HAD family phosphatase [Allobranchiibius sp.]
MRSSLPESGNPAVPAAHDLPAVVFDLGNVLIDWNAHAAISAEVGDERATVFLADLTFDFFGWNAAQDAGRTWAQGESAALATHPHYREEILAYRAHFGRSLVGPIDGVVEILRELHSSAVPLFALTNWSFELFPVARERFDFLQLFDDIVVSGEEGLAKPDPAIFALLAERMQDSWHRMPAVFVDDRMDNVAAANTAGMDGLLYTEPDKLRDDLAVRGLVREQPLRATVRTV